MRNEASDLYAFHMSRDSLIKTYTHTHRSSKK